jgi:hypothetical protein
MKTRAAKAALLIACSICLLFAQLVVFKEAGCGTAPGQPVPAQKPKVAGSVVAYYFYGNFRCDSCRKIEQYSRGAIEECFPGQLKDGLLTFTLINSDLPENAHYRQDYQLYTKSLVIALLRDGKQVKWKNLAEVWQHLDDKEGFYAYVCGEIQKFLEEA